MYDAVTAGGTKDRNRGYIKVARELAKVVYVVWKKGVAYTEQPPTRPGGQRVRSSTAKARLGRFFAGHSRTNVDINELSKERGQNCGVGSRQTNLASTRLSGGLR